MGGAGPGQPADDDGADDLLVQDLGVALHQVLDQETVLEQTHEEAMCCRTPAPLKPPSSRKARHRTLEALHEVDGAEVVQARSRLPPPA